LYTPLPSHPSYIPRPSHSSQFYVQSFGARGIQSYMLMFQYLKSL
jgi:hypothetical protein